MTIVNSKHNFSKRQKNKIYPRQGALDDILCLLRYGIIKKITKEPKRTRPSQLEIRAKY